jgi:hypothetical protein
MSTACVPTCLSSACFFADSDPRTCLFCPRDTCPRGTFWSELDNCTACAPCAHRLAVTVRCKLGLEYLIAGSPTADARCGTCADCSGASESVACTRSSIRECASCGALDSWSGAWSETGCVLVCRAADGYTKFHTAQGEVCRKCLSCEPGYEHPAVPPRARASKLLRHGLAAAHQRRVDAAQQLGRECDEPGVVGASRLRESRGAVLRDVRAHA